MQAGLNTVNLSQMNTFQQWLLWMHILGGSAIFVSIFVIHVRKKAFEKRFGAILKAQQDQRRKQRATIRDSGRSFSIRRSLSFRSSPSQANETGEVKEKPDLDQPENSNGSSGGALRIDTSSSGGPSRGTGTEVEPLPANDASGTSHASRSETEDPRYAEPNKVNPNQSPVDHITFLPDTSFNPTNTMARASRIKRRSSTFSFTGVGASPVSTSLHRPFFSGINKISSTRTSTGHTLSHDASAPWHLGNMLRKEVVGRNSQFHGLTLQEREQLGGVEYRAIQLLSWVVPLYFILWQLLGCLAVGAWMNNYASDITGQNGIIAW
jgi:hypothetical protein